MVERLGRTHKLGLVGSGLSISGFGWRQRNCRRLCFAVSFSAERSPALAQLDAAFAFALAGFVRGLCEKLDTPPDVVKNMVAVPSRL